MVPTWNRAGRFWRDRRAVTAVEFALVAPPFFLLLATILELALMSVNAIILESGSLTASRLVQTGQIQAAANQRQAFAAAICDSTFAIFTPCDRIQIDVRTWPSFQAIPLDATKPPPPWLGRNADNDLTGTAFQPGLRDEVVTVVVAYRFNFVTPVVGFIFRDKAAPTNSRLLFATAAFRNEPF